MNILMINPTHPNTPHISAVRAWRFAQELATLGHRVVLLTASESNSTPNESVDSAHDWRHPIVITCSDATPTPKWASSLPRLLRRAATAAAMVHHGGPARRWLIAATRVGVHLPSDCRPSVIWCTFGQMEALFAARHIARKLSVPWVLDVKDNWELYVPRGLRKLMTWRTYGCTAVTTNSQSNRDLMRRWRNTDATVIYSGIDKCFFANSDLPPPAYFEINLVGGIYFPERLEEFLSGVADWYRTIPADQRAKVRMRHIGAQTDLVRASARSIVPGLALDLPGYMPASQMAHLCQRAAVNAYIRHAGTFHHKLLELLACGRTVVAYPSESGESEALAAGSPMQLQTASSAAGVARILAGLSLAFFSGGTMPSFTQTHLRCHRWPEQAGVLEQVLSDATSAVP